MREIPLTRPCWGIREAIAILQALTNRGRYRYGVWTGQVEKRIARLLDIGHVFLCTSGTSALEMALWSLGLDPGFEVIVPSFTFVSTATAVIRQGGIPVFADIEEETLNISPVSIREKLSEQTRVIIPVHYAGTACEMDSVIEIAREHNVFVIEDAAHAFDAKYNGRYLGTLGDLGCFSFHVTKNLSCGEGGALVTNNKGLAERIEILRDKGTNRSKFLRGEVDRYEWVSEGTSFILSDILSAVLSVQLDRMTDIRRIREQKAAYLLQKLNKFRAEIVLPNAERLSGTNWHIFYIRMKSRKDRDAMLNYLHGRGIQATFHYLPLHLSPYARSKYHGQPGSLPVTERVADTIVRLPFHPMISEHELDYIVSSVAGCLMALRHGGSPHGS